MLVTARPLLLVALLIVSLAAGRGSGLPLTPVASVPLPGAASRFDYESLDANTGRLFIAHLAASEVVVYDVNANRVVATIPNVTRSTAYSRFRNSGVFTRPRPAATRSPSSTPIR